MKLGQLLLKEWIYLPQNIFDRLVDFWATIKVIFQRPYSPNLLIRSVEISQLWLVVSKN